MTSTRDKPRPNSEPDGLRAPRRHAGGARREASERVRLRAAGFETNGWTLNVSRGGVRAIVEDPVRQGIEYEIVVGDEETVKPRRASVVWLQEEADGQIVGLKYLDGEDGSMPPKDG
ncbi:MAG TPA: PilZ domain-containing protein [Polyangiaceae bacterium]|nr:PilZ domain-containing protein [Polyangiaceae bacterium]